MIVEKSKIIVPNPGQLQELRKQAAIDSKAGTEAVYILLADGRLEVYRGTEATKQGYFKVTYDPSNKRKRPNVPQWTLA